MSKEDRSVHPLLFCLQRYTVVDRNTQDLFAKLMKVKIQIFVVPTAYSLLTYLTGIPTGTDRCFIKLLFAVKKYIHSTCVGTFFSTFWHVTRHIYELCQYNTIN